jgi:superoxide dismutase, Fe-Mn family
MYLTRRNFIKQTTLAATGLTLIGVEGLMACNSSKRLMSVAPLTNNEFTLPKLSYAYDALEPFIDKMTMEIHHSKHHNAYVTNLNKAIVGNSNTVGKSIEEICGMAGKLGDTIRNNGGGHYNHSLFWSLMKPNAEKMPKGDLADAINANFGSFDKMKEAFNDAAMKRFGSGWAWLVLDANKKLQIGSTPNQDNPLMDVATLKGTPILALDVWEHAYYLKYQNKRKDYVESWWNLVDWDKAGQSMR